MRRFVTICAVAGVMLVVRGVVQAGTIASDPDYKASTDLAIGAVTTIRPGTDFELTGFAITAEFQINLLYQAGILDEDIDNINHYWQPMSSTYNFPDYEEYILNVSATGGLTIYEYDGLQETVGGSDIKWTLTAWHQTILAGDIIDNLDGTITLQVLPAGTYRPFVNDPPVNNVEVFDGDLDCEVQGYTFTGAIGDIGDGSVLSVELPPAPTEVWIDDDFDNSTPGWGTTHFNSIQDGIDAVAGSTVNVAAGTYTEYLIINKDNITIEGAGIDVSIIDLDGLIPYWHYSGCSSSFASRAGVYFSGYGNPDEVVENCAFKGFTVKNAGLNPPITASGTHTGASHTTILTDPYASFPAPDGLVGQWVHNYGDRDTDYDPARSYGQITANTATTVTVTALSGGVDNDWDNGDEYVITPYEEFHNSWWIHYPNYDWVRGIGVANGKNILIQNCKVTNCGYSGISVSKARCTSFYRNEDITVDNCIVTDHQRGGIGIGSLAGAFAVTNCTIERNKSPHYADATREYCGYGIDVSGRSSSLMASGLISNNTCNDNGFIGINVTKYTDGVIVQNNTVTGHNLDEDGAGIFMYHWGSPQYCKNHVVVDNVVAGNIRGIIAYYASNCAIERNTITTDSGSFETGQGAIKIDNALNVEVKDNTISCDGVGINVTSTGSYGNTFSGNFIDGAMFAGIYIRSGAYDNTFLCNTITNTVNDTFTQYADWGSHDGGDNQATLTDSTQSWADDAFIGMTVINLSDGSEGTITDNDATTVTAILSGGTEDDWDNGDEYDIVYDDTQADGVFLRGGSCYAGGHAGTGNVFHENSIHGNADDGMENQTSTDVDATDNWWGNASGPAHASNPAGTGDSVSDGVIYNPWAGVEPACVPTSPTGDNVLWLNATGDSLYVKVGDPVVVDMDVLNLLQKVNGCQALLGYSSTYLTAAPGCVVAGGGVWDEVIYQQFPADGELDTAIGVQAWGHIGTDADGTVAVISFTAGSEGTTQLVFRSDVNSEYSTMLSDMAANPVYPTKINSQTIVIDSSLPTISIDSATQDSTELLGGCPTNAVQGLVSIEVTASESGDAGLAGPPTVTVTDFASNPMVVTGPVSVVGDVYTYEVTVLSTTANGTATITADVCDNAGNCAAQATDSFCINKNEITGQIELESFVGSSRIVTFMSTGTGNSKTWVIDVDRFGQDGNPAAISNFTLTDVPDGSTDLSAKTAWNLRRKVALGSGGDNQWTADLAGSNKLLGGDLNGSNFVNILDYSILATRYLTSDPVADINGSGAVNIGDYNILGANYFKSGDDE